MENILTLKDAKVGNSYTVTAILGSGPLKRRIRDMGLTKGSRIFVRKVAPLGDPVQINVRHYELSIRKDDASLIEITQEK